jgi:hypothetical protein
MAPPGMAGLMDTIEPFVDVGVTMLHIFAIEM